ncbi:MAG: alpha/beta-type small acid-soluble spore protein [Firmicutes bacterium]|nr:alpha/beta-type small acid-soluble spore protein [Bacillota bacterium]
MANSTQGGNSKNRAFAPAGAGFNLDQFKNEVASEIGLSLGQQGSFGQNAAGQGSAAQNFGNVPAAGAAQNSAAGAGSPGGLVAGAAGTAAQTDFEVSSTLGQKQNSPAAKVAEEQGQNQ